jgi:PAS domain S-box-containing protein
MFGVAQQEFIGEELMEKQGRLLIVDDQPNILEIMEYHFVRCDFEVETAASSEAALQILRYKEFDVLITDIQLPGKDGIALMKEAIKYYPDIGCILMTGHANVETAIGAMRLGASNYFVKPMNMDTLVLSVQKAMEKSRLVRENRAQQENLAKINKVLLQERNKSNSILKAAGEGIVGIDKEGLVTFVNPTVELLLGWGADELIGRNFHELVHYKKPTGDLYPMDKCPVCAARHDKVWYQGSNEFFWRKDGSNFPIWYVSSPIVEEDKASGSVITFNDITEQKEAEGKLKKYSTQLEKMVEERTAQLEKTNKQLKRDIAARKKAEKEAEDRRRQLVEADKMVSIGTLVAGVAHEINNPNNFIMMNSSLLQRTWKDCRKIMDQYYQENGDFLLGGMRYDEMVDNIPELFAGIKDGSERIKQIVLSLKDYARQESSDMAQPVDINDVLSKALVLLANPVKKATNRLIVTYAENLPMVKGNFQRLEQVLINIIQNACHALTEPSKSIEITTEHDVKREKVIVMVSDEGCGISQNDLKRIQDPFFTTKRNMGGTGLGLSVSAGIIEEHKGTITFNSKKGKGTKVTISLPVGGGD